MNYKKITLPFKSSDLEPHIDTLTVETHYNKHHSAYEAKFNEGFNNLGIEEFTTIEKVMNNFNNFDDKIKPLIKNAGGGLINHNFYWNQFIVKRELTDKETETRNKIIEQYGTIEDFKEEVLAKGLGVFGSGWVWVILDNEEYKVITTPNQENPWMENKNNVILGIDLWEHAYYIKYKSNRKEYIDNIWPLTIFK